MKIIRRFSSIPSPLPKLYAKACLDKPKTYYDYKDYRFNYGMADDFDLFAKIGKGRYSEVYTGFDVVKNRKVIVKILKPVNFDRVKREIKILFSLKEVENVIKLLDVVFDNSSQTISLVFEFFALMDFHKIFLKLNDVQIKMYLYELLRTLDQVHSCGIMHRDVKPSNIIVDEETHKIKLIDWGLAEFYLPNTSYNVRVCSKSYKGPELLLNNNYYDYSLDVWSTGIMFAAMIFKRANLFYADQNIEILWKIAKFFGTDDIQEYINKYKLTIDAEIEQRLHESKFSKKSWEKLITTENEDSCDEIALDLLDKMLKIDHTQRITPKEALLHPYFDSIRNKKENK